MKKTCFFVILFCLAFAAGCASPAKQGGVDKAPQKTAKTSPSACKADADCVRIMKDCCLCDGVDAVNKASYAEVEAARAKRCENKPCNRMFCWYNVDIKCVEGHCMAVDKPIEEK